MKRELNVVAALIKKGEKFLFCQRKKEDRYGLLWEFPGGSVEGHETFPAAIEREIKEELNLEVKAERLVGKFSDEDEELKIKIFLFICGIKAGTLETKECNDFGFFTIIISSSIS